MSSTRIDDCADEIDTAVAAWMRGTITAFEAVQRVLLSTRKAVIATPGSSKDIDVLADYAILQAETIAFHRSVFDRALMDSFLHELSLAANEREIHLDFELLLIDLDSRLAANDPTARDELIMICSSGYGQRPRMFSNIDRTCRILDVAHKHRVVAALEAATQGRSDRRQLADWNGNRRGFLHGLDLLAHLAQDPHPEISDAARGTLLNLCEWHE